MTNRSIVIVGAPRSGTSLMQKILRESPGIISVPHESSVIWNKFIHPENNNWKFEGVELPQLSKEQIESVRKEFQSQSMNNNCWALWSQLGLMKTPWLAKKIRWLYPRVSSVIPMILTSDNRKGRLVEKTVHGGLWMNLIDEVLEKPIFIHITRDGLNTIKSITNGWNDSERFGCYQLPQEIKYQKKEFQNIWCFPLIKNWEKVCDRPLFEISTFQWLKIQKSILEYSKEKLPRERYIRIKLEDLVDNPECLLDLLNKLDLPLNEYFEKLLAEMPKVNASMVSPHILDSTEESWVNKEIKEVQRQLGY